VRLTELVKEFGWPHPRRSASTIGRGKNQWQPGVYMDMNATREEPMDAESEIGNGELRELARRTGDALDVVLWWDPAADRVFVDVEDERVDERFRIAVGKGQALDAFNHPYAYLRWSGREPLAMSLGRGKRAGTAPAQP
jgi:hypothetical protein